MEILKVSTDWAKAEVFSAKMVGLLSLSGVLLAIAFWQLGRTPMAKAFIWPLLAASLFLAAVSAGLYFTNKPRIVQFETAYNNNPDRFIQNEIARTSKSMRELRLVFQILPALVVLAASLLIFSQTPMWRAIGVTTILLASLLLLIDSNTDARNSDYHQKLITAKP